MTFTVLFTARHPVASFDTFREPTLATIHETYSTGARLFYATVRGLGCGKSATTRKEALAMLTRDHALTFLEVELPWLHFEHASLRFDCDQNCEPRRTEKRDGGPFKFTAWGQVRDNATGRLYRFEVFHDKADLIEVELRLDGKRVRENAKRGLRLIVRQFYDATFRPETLHAIRNGPNRYNANEATRILNHFTGSELPFDELDAARLDGFLRAARFR